MRWVAGIAAGLMLMTGAAWAGGGLPGGLPEKMLKRMKEAPDAFVSDAADLILGFGRDGGIDKAGIGQAIAVERASARAKEMRQLMSADLDGDGLARADEIAVLVQAAPANGRGRVALAFDAADTDRDGGVSASEMAAQVQREGEDAVSPARAAALAALMQLDLDSDGSLTLGEVRDAVKLAEEAA